MLPDVRRADMRGVSKVGWLPDHVPADLGTLPDQHGKGEGEQGDLTDEGTNCMAIDREQSIGLNRLLICW